MGERPRPGFQKGDVVSPPFGLPTEKPTENKNIEINKELKNEQAKV